MPCRERPQVSAVSQPCQTAPRKSSAKASSGAAWASASWANPYLALGSEKPSRIGSGGCCGPGRLRDWMSLIFRVGHRHGFPAGADPVQLRQLQGRLHGAGGQRAESAASRSSSQTFSGALKPRRLIRLSARLSSAGGSPKALPAGQHCRQPAGWLGHHFRSQRGTLKAEQNLVVFRVAVVAFGGESSIS